MHKTLTPKLHLPLALLRQAPAGHHAGNPAQRHGTLSVQELRSIVADLIG